MSSLIELLTSGELFCRACLATGNDMKYFDTGSMRQYFAEHKIEDLPRPFGRSVCHDCERHIKYALEFRDRVAEITLLLKEAIESLNGCLNYTNGNKLKMDAVEADDNLLDGNIKSEADTVNDSWQDEIADNRIEPETAEDCLPLVELINRSRRKKTRKRNEKKIPETRRRVVEDNDKFAVVSLSREEQIEELKETANGSKFANSVYKCQFCIKGFGYEGTYRKHMSVHEPISGAHKCDTCQTYVASGRSFAKHVANHSRRFRCLKCGFTKRTRRGVVEHYGAEHEADKSRLACEQCGKVFLKRSVLRQHVRYRHTENIERQECEHCGMTFRTIESLRRHMLKHINRDLPEKEKRFPCGQCTQKFLNATLLKIHQRKHSQDCSFYCALCDKFYKSEVILNWHLKYSSKHYDINKRIPCPHCDKCLVNKRDLSKHIEKDHLGIANFKCNLCPRAYYTNNLLNVHLKRSHQKYIQPKVHMCDYCGKAFSMRNTLICHINTHTGAKPYACNECDARFGHSGVLYTHVKLVHRKLKRNARGKFEAAN